MKSLVYVYTIAAIVGVIAGYMYYAFIGCKTGACPLQSNAVFMSAYGGFAGLLLGNIMNSFISKRKKKYD